jgi:hypothetical protein
MFDNKSKTIKELQAKICRLEWQLDECNNDRKTQSFLIKELKDQLTNKSKGAEVCVDFVKMNAYAIQKHYNPGTGLYTAITHYDETGRIQIQNLYVDDDRHKELVKEFEQVKKLRSKK